MKLWDIVKTVGAGVISATVPGGALLVSAINEFLPDDKKIPPNATGDDLKNTIDSLPPEQRAEIMGKEFDVELTQIKESNSTLRVMLESDAQNPHSTRPYIAKQAFHIVAFAVIVAVSMWAYGVGVRDAVLVKSVMDGWPFILATIGPFITLLWAYFGILKQEHRDRLNAANGSVSPVGIISALFKR